MPLRLHALHRFVRLVPAALAILAASACAAPGPELPRARPAEVGLSPSGLEAAGELLDEHVASRRLAGAVGLVARHGKVVWHEAFGQRDLEAGRPMTEDTIFRICSMTKPITCVGALMLVEEGKLALDDPVGEYIPALRDLEVAVKVGEGDDATWRHVDAEQPITVRHLFTHTAGFTYGFFGRPHLAEQYREAGVTDGLVATEGTIADGVRRLAEAPLKHQPGTAWEYGLSIDVLGRVIEVVSGQPLDEYLREEIFEPLGMDDTHFRPPEAKRDRLAAVYRPGDDGAVERLPEGVVHTGDAVHSAGYPYEGPGTYFSGGAGLVSTTTDYARFLLMLAGDGELGGVRILRPETVERMTSDQTGELDVWIGDHGDAFGLGVGVLTEDGDPDLGSPGTWSWGGFYYTYFWVDPEEELVGLFMSQIYPWTGLSLRHEFRRTVYDALEE